MLGQGANLISIGILGWKGLPLLYSFKLFIEFSKQVSNLSKVTELVGSRARARSQDQLSLGRQDINMLTRSPGMNQRHNQAVILLFCLAWLENSYTPRAPVPLA